MTGALLFVVGFTAVFVLGSIFVTTAGRALIEHRTLLMRLGGVVVIVMGLVFLGVGTQREAKIAVAPAGRAGRRPGARRGLRARLGPVHRADARRRARPGLGHRVDPQVGRSVVLAVAYGLGLGLPFILIAAGLDRAGRASGWLRRHQRGIQRFGGVMLVLVGLLMVTGLWQDLNTWLQTELVDGFEVAV